MEFNSLKHVKIYSCKEDDITDNQRKQTYTGNDLICLSKESVYGIFLSNMAGHFYLSLQSIPDLSNDPEHQTNYV